MGKAKLISLQKVFWRFLIILISGLFLSVAIPFLLLALASSAGYVTYANNAEHSVQKISPIIAAAPDITKVAIPSYCEYLILDTDIRDVIDLADLLAMTDTAQLQKAKVQKLRERLDTKEAEIDRYQRLLRSLYESLADGLIDQSEYQNLKKSYTNRRAQAEEQADAIRGEMEQEINRSDQGLGWIEEFRRYQNIEVLDRSIVVRLIERILIFRDCRVDIV